MKSKDRKLHCTRMPPSHHHNPHALLFIRIRLGFVSKKDSVYTTYIYPQTKAHLFKQPSLDVTHACSKAGITLCCCEVVFQKTGLQDRKTARGAVSTCTLAGPWAELALGMPCIGEVWEAVLSNKADSVQEPRGLST